MVNDVRMKIFIKKFINSSIPRLIILLLLFSACQPQTGVPVSVTTQPFESQNRWCSGRFVAHELPHTTGANIERIGFFLSNGAGLAINDLDQDGNLDIVLGNLLGANQIFWNVGDMRFDPETLFEGSSRAVLTADLNRDQRTDLLFTTRHGELHYWENMGERRFEKKRLAGINDYAGFAYSANVADLDLDGDLDIVTGSYDASLEKLSSGVSFRERGFPGVHVYWQEEDHFRPEQLSSEAQALALDLVDLNQDQRLDILVGNDFDMPDRVWINRATGFEPAAPFSTTTMSTMSFDSGDIDNNGRSEIFAADMHPYSDAPEIMAQWEPVMEAMHVELAENDPQTMENVLQAVGVDERYENAAPALGVPFSGWSWSAKFGDLDQDGWLDLYVVNGMQALDNFSHLENDTLVEENQVYQNLAGKRFESADWGLNSRLGGRSMSMADLDRDGDLDIVVNNLSGPTQLFENQLCAGDSLLVDLAWPSSPNSAALGAQVVVELNGIPGQQSRTVKALSGYLSGDPTQLHFGIPKGDSIKRLIITWPDGHLTILNQVEIGQIVKVERIN